MVQLGATMYSIGMHYSTVRALATNPEWFAEKTLRISQPTKQFKADATIPGMKKYFTATCCPSQYEGTPEKTKASAKRNLSLLLDSDDGDDDDGGQSRQKILTRKIENDFVFNWMMIVTHNSLFNCVKKHMQKNKQNPNRKNPKRTRPKRHLSKNSLYILLI